MRARSRDARIGATARRQRQSRMRAYSFHSPPVCVDHVENRAILVPREITPHIFTTVSRACWHGKPRVGVSSRVTRQAHRITDNRAILDFGKMPYAVVRAARGERYCAVRIGPSGFWASVKVLAHYSIPLAMRRRLEFACMSLTPQKGCKQPGMSARNGQDGICMLHYYAPSNCGKCCPTNSRR